MSLPQQKKLAIGMQLPPCESCMARGGDIRYMRLWVGRDFAQDHGWFFYECDNCGRQTQPNPCPLYWLSASNMDELTQILQFEAAGAKLDVLRVSDLSPPAREVLDKFGTNPFALAEAMAELALKRGAADQKVKELEERLAGSDTDGL